MSRRAKPACIVCGKTGYWVGYSPAFGEVRCINHLHPEETPMAMDDELPDTRPRLAVIDEDVP